MPEKVVTRAKQARVWPWFAVSIALIVVAMLILSGGASTIMLAVGFLGLFGAFVRLISRKDERPRDDRRVPAGHSGM